MVGAAHQMRSDIFTMILLFMLLTIMNICLFTNIYYVMYWRFLLQSGQIKLAVGLNLCLPVISALSGYLTAKSE